MTDIAYQPLSVAEQVFKDLVWDPLIRGGEVALEGYVPFLALPVIKQVDEEIISLVSNYLFNQFRLFLDLSAIQFVNAVHQQAYREKSIALAVLAHDQGVTSDAYKKAREDAKAALAALGSYGGR